MGIYKDHLKELRNQDYFFYILFSISVIYLFTKAISTTTGHLLAFLVISIGLFLFIDMKSEDSNDIYHQLETDLKMLSDNEEDYYYLYMDSDLVTLFLEIKNDFHEFNPIAYTDALKAANNILMCRKAIETKLCPQPVIPNLSDNFAKELSFYEDSSKKCDQIIQNGYATFEFAKKQYKFAVNNLHSMILTLHVDPAMQFKHNEMIKRARLLLKRNIDIIKRIYQKNTSLIHPQITFYDTFVPYNEHTEEDEINKNFTDKSFNFF